MASGIRVWDQAGAALLVDTSTWCGQILGTRTIPAGHTSGSFTDANLALGRGFAFVMPSDNNTGASSAGNPVNTSVSVSGTTVSYSAGNSAVVIIYGIF